MGISSSSTSSFVVDSSGEVNNDDDEEDDDDEDNGSLCNIKDDFLLSGLNDLSESDELNIESDKSKILSIFPSPSSLDSHL
jgi:hypothetical protein